MRMPPLHLADNPVRHRRGSAQPVLLRQHQLPGQVKQHIAQLVRHRVTVRFGDGVIQLEHFLHQVGSQCLAGLDPVPAAASPQVAHQRHHPLERCIVLLHDFQNPYHSRRRD